MSITELQDPVIENPGPETALALQGLFRSFSKGLVHPETGLRLLGSEEPDSLDLKFPPDELVQVLPFDHDIAPVGLRALVENCKFLAEHAVCLDLEKGDLALVILLVVEKPVTLDALSGHAIQFPDFDDGVFTRRLSEVTVVIVTRGNVEMQKFHVTGYDSISLLAIRGETDTVPATLQPH